MGRVWTKLEAGWYRDPVLVACAAEEPASLWAWPVLVGMAMEQSHAVDNPDGVIDTSIPQLQQVLRLDAPQIARALQVLTDGEMVTVSGGKGGTLRVALTAFQKWNAPRYSNAKRVAESRFRKSVGKPPAETPFAGVLSPNEMVATQDDTKREIEKKKTNNIVPKVEEQNAAESGSIRSVFDHWVKTCATGGRPPILNDKRRSKIRARLREGFTTAELCTAIDGFAGDPFYNGDSDGKRKLELQWRLADAAQVERGIALAKSPEPTGAGSGALKGRRL